MTWIADDDTRCHDDGLRPLLIALAGRPDATLVPTATVALVREVGGRLRTGLVNADLRLHDVLDQRRRALQPTAPGEAAGSLLGAADRLQPQL